MDSNTRFPSGPVRAIILPDTHETKNGVLKPCARDGKGEMRRVRHEL